MKYLKKMVLVEKEGENNEKGKGKKNSKTNRQRHSSNLFPSGITPPMRDIRRRWKIPLATVPI